MLFLLIIDSTRGPAALVIKKSHACFFLSFFLPLFLDQESHM